MSAGRDHARPLLGLAYLLVLALLVALSIAVYEKALPWQRTERVSIVTSTPGLELNPHSDVKFQGVLVGEVRQVTSDGAEATIELAIDPDRLGIIPADVDAAIVPKTLFGEKYVDLRPRSESSSESLAAGAVIEQSRTSVEIGALYSRLVPLLRTLKPAELSVTLSNIARAVDGRGEQIARTLNQLQELLGELDPHLATLVHDLRQGAEVTDLYHRESDALLAVLDNSAAISTDLLVPREKSFAAFLDVLTETTDKLEDVLAENAATLVQLTGRQRPVLALLDEYSSMLPCFVDALALADRAAVNAGPARGPYANLGIDMIVHQRPYTYPDDVPGGPGNDANDHVLPDWAPSWQPHCPEAAPWLLEIGFPEAGSQPGQGTAQTWEPSSTTTQTADRTWSRSERDAALDEARLALARAIAAQRLQVAQDQVPTYAVLLAAPLLVDGEAEAR